MSLQSLLDLSQSYGKKVGLSEERVREQLPDLRNLIAFYREYPDLLIDFMVEKDPSCKFKFYFYQSSLWSFPTNISTVVSEPISRE